MPGRLRRITVYETPARFYLVGCDLSGTKYNVLKIDRIDSKALVTGEPENDYSKADIMELLSTVNEGNSIVCRPSSGTSKKGRPNGGLVERVFNAFGILGVVRFLEGYYLIVITKATVTASFGYHSIYKVAEVAMMSLASEDHAASAEEQRYVKLFQSVDLSTDFYFSYTYDLSRTLQENALSTNWRANGDRTMNSDKKFVWNKFLLEPLRNNLVSERWFVEVVHGFVRQQLLELPCSKFMLVLVGRRSSDYAGTRYLKRGANLKGDVANDVETEQILWDMASSANLSRGRFSAFVQRRGSVPLRWSQDPATRGVVGKPLILIGIHEPHAQTAAAHFRDLKKKYGDPIVVMNLVKRREKRRHENLLHEQFLRAVNYLNQFVPSAHRICYVSFDVARCNKKSGNVLVRLQSLGERAVLKSGWFQTFPLPHRVSSAGFSPLSSPCGRFLLQQGICRTNCVDCLDRTNVAQFGIGKAALAYQLLSFGMLDEPYISINSEVCRVLEELFDEHGDTMAWQYAGSQLVHSIKTYKKTAALQERSRDVIQTLSRYYSNTFGDYDKQAAINLFLGLFRPQISSSIHLWDLPSDFYLHFRPGERISKDYCAWWTEDDDEVVGDDFVFVPPLSERTTRERRSASREAFGCIRIDSDDDLRDFYRTFELTSLDLRLKQMAGVELKMISVQAINQEITTGQFMKLFKSDAKTPPTAPKSAKGKANKESDDEDEEGEEGKAEAEETVVEEEVTFKEEKPHKEYIVREARAVSLHVGLVSNQSAYAPPGPPSQTSRSIYEMYINKGGLSVEAEEWAGDKRRSLLHAVKAAETAPQRMHAFFTADTACHTEIPEVSDRSRIFYEQSCLLSRPLSDRDSRNFHSYPLYPSLSS